MKILKPRCSLKVCVSTLRHGACEETSLCSHVMGDMFPRCRDVEDDIHHLHAVIWIFSHFFLFFLALF